MFQIVLDLLEQLPYWIKIQTKVPSTCTTLRRFNVEGQQLTTSLKRTVSGFTFKECLFYKVYVFLYIQLWEISLIVYISLQDD